eukprot:5243176-Amphidinium_carterae.2
MLLSATGKGCACALREAFRAVKAILEASGMRLNKTKCVVVANTDACRLECRRAWNRMRVDVSFTTHYLGVDVRCGPWRNPVQQSGIKSFTAAMSRVRMLNLPLRFKMNTVRALYPLVIYGSEVWTRKDLNEHALGRGAQLRTLRELAHGAGPGPGGRGMEFRGNWARGSRADIRHLHSLCERLKPRELSPPAEASAGRTLTTA